MCVLNMERYGQILLSKFLYPIIKLNANGKCLPQNGRKAPSVCVNTCYWSIGQEARSHYALFLTTYAQESRALKSTRNPTTPKTFSTVMSLTLALLAWHLSTAICLHLSNANEWRVLLFKVLALVCVTTIVRSVPRKNLNGFGLNSETTYQTRSNCFLK